MKDKNATEKGEATPCPAMRKARRAGPATAEELARARRGQFDVALTAYKSVPRHWFPPILDGRKILCLAGEAGSQAHILAAANAQVTVFSPSETRLAHDCEISAREQLDISTILGDFISLSVFPNEYFDMVFCPSSVPYVPEVRRVFRECGRILRHGGVMMMGTSLPCLTEEDCARRNLDLTDGSSRHTLEELIGGQIEAGMVIIGFYEDADEEAICDYIPRYFATRAMKI